VGLLSLTYKVAEQATHFPLPAFVMNAYLSKAFNLQVPAKVRVPCVHMLKRKDTQYVTND
jgi:hypothetical protein